MKYSRLNMKIIFKMVKMKVNNLWKKIEKVEIEIENWRN